MRKKIISLIGSEHKFNGSYYARFAEWSANICGKPFTFAVAVFSIFVWAISGPYYEWSDTWQLIANTGTTLITFLMLFLLQNTQNRDTEAIQNKLDAVLIEIALLKEKNNNKES